MTHMKYIKNFVMNFLSIIKNRITEGSERSAKIKKNIFAMFLIKGGSILISLFLVPITLNYVDKETYGIWLTLSSMVTWVHFFDIGINNGLKNKLTEALAVKDLTMARKYVSTTYAILSLIFIPIMVVLLVANPYINWGSLLNLSAESTQGLTTVIAIIISYFSINFVLSTINIVLQSDQKPSDASLRQLLQQVLSLLIIYILTLTTKGSLLLLCVGLCISPLIILVYFNFSLFRGRYKEIAPSFSYIDFSVAPNLFQLGIMFFVCQIAFMIQTHFANFLIIRYYGAADVTNYNISSRYFSVAYMVWGIMITPLWAAVTDAIAKKDYKWIIQITRRFIKLLSMVTVILIIMLLVSNFAYKIWVGDKISIPLLLSFWVMLDQIVKMMGSLFVQILNGAGILKVQTYLSFITPIIFFGVFFLLKEKGMGVESVVIASIVSNFNYYIVAPLQYKYNFINNDK